MPVPYWLLTSTFYGQWLPGDPRGFVSRVTDQRPDDPKDRRHRFEHDLPGTPYDENLPGLHRAAASQLKSEPIAVNMEQANLLGKQFEETATCRRWHLIAYSIMINHVHLVAKAPDDPPPTKILGDFKAYGSRILNKDFGKRDWWTYDGSKRKLSDESAIRGAAIYVVCRQYQPLVVWVNSDYATVEELQKEYEEWLKRKSSNND